MDISTITGFATKAVSSEFGLGWIIFFVVVAFIILFSLKHILDIAVDLWKLPFTIVLDALDVMAYNNPYFDLFAAAGSFVVFWVFAKRGNHMSKILGFIAAAEALIGIWIFPQYAFITNIVPTSTLLMFVAIWAD